MAQNASPSLHEVVMLHTRTFLYPTVCRLVHSSKASLPLNVPDPELFRFESISVKLRANHEKIFLFERFLDWSFSSQWFWRQVCLFQRQNWLSFLSRLIWRLQMKLSKWKSSINNFRNPRDQQWIINIYANQALMLWKAKTDKNENIALRSKQSDLRYSGQTSRKHVCNQFIDINVWFFW